MKNRIKLIIFDLYGVIVLGSYVDTCRWLSEKFKLPYQKVWDIIYAKYFNMAALRKITDRQSFELAIKELGLPVRWDVVYKKHLSFLTLSNQSFHYALSLQRRGYTILLLTKNTPVQFGDIVKKTRISKYFPHIINTYDLQLSKASRETMNYVFKKFKTRPSETIMVDDQKVNLIFPEKMGAHVILYRSFKQMQRKITKLLK